MNLIHKLQRGLCAVAGAWLGAFALASLLVPKTIAARAIGVTGTSTVGALMQLGAGMRFGLALVALIAALMPKPPRPLVTAVALALLLGVAGVGFNRALGIYNAADVKPFLTWLYVDGFFALALLGTEIARSILRPGLPERRPKAEVEG